jgi:hypothetical protein
MKLSQNVNVSNQYRITAVTKDETDIIVRITVSPICSVTLSVDTENISL